MFIAFWCLAVLSAPLLSNFQCIFFYAGIRLIYQSAIRKGLSYFIPSYNSVLDMTFSLPPATHTPSATLQNISVLAGHFQWNVWRGLPGYTTMQQRVRFGHHHRDGGVKRDDMVDATSSNDEDELLHRIPSCFVMGRHPVDRVISYYYQRCYREASCRLYQVRFGDLSADDMYFVVVLFRQAKYLPDGKTLMFSDDGTHDSMCRTALGERTTTGGLVQDMIDANGGILPIQDDVPEEKHQKALDNINHCVVGMLEEWELSKNMMKHWFPWMQMPERSQTQSTSATGEMDAAATGTHTATNPHLMKLYDGKETVSTISSQVRESIEELIPCDMKLYRNMLARFEMQKRHLIKEGVVS